MFSNLFFLILNLLLISSIIDEKSSPFLSEEPGFAFVLLLIAYPFFLLFLHLQSHWLRNIFKRAKESILFLENLQLLVFFSFFYFFLGAYRWPVEAFSPFGITIFSSFSLFLYFLGLFICHYSIAQPSHQKASFVNAWLSICFLIPFIIPFLLVAFFSEAGSHFSLGNALNYFGLSENNMWNFLLLGLFNIVIILVTLIFLPPLAILIWHCPQLKNSDLKIELENLCKRANFKHAGLRIWSIMNNSMTAAIIGIKSRFRYILFTQKLIDNVPNHAIVAILAHEIGHSYHLHLFFYPFILVGMVIIGSLVPNFFIFSIQDTDLIKNLSYLIPIFLFLLFALTMAVYFRYIFGYFSRIFERQADLHIFQLNIPAAHMVEALDTLGVAAGNIHREPNWHHYSIEERIDFINRADSDRSLIIRHARFVRISVFSYFLILVMFFFVLWNLYF